MGLADNIKRLRTNADLTQAKLAEMVGVTRATVTQWETGRSQPRMGAIEKLAEVFGVSLAALVSDNTLPANSFPVKGMPMGRVPLVGNTHAGKPCLPEELDEFPEVLVPQFLLDRDPGSYGLEVDGDCMDRVCPPGMVAVVQPGVPANSGDVVVATIDGADSIMRRMTVINGDLILSPESHNPDHENMYIAAQDDRQVHVEHVAYFQSREAF